ncbi:MAG: hypothetical protein M3077_05755 [Candidatus Dormibacteraeota bacterium]|nr:hypothetical protein [Candidatus Dormibacteraeota bacterium]
MGFCTDCGAPLRVRELVDPPDMPGMVSAELGCSNAECRALHDGRGVFIREHPVTKLRRLGGA